MLRLGAKFGEIWVFAPRYC